MTNHKFVAVLNKKVDSGKIMNALAHMTAGLVGSTENISEMGIIDYQDKDGGSHLASKHPFIILKAKNSNQIHSLRENLIEKGVEFASFTEAMTVGSYEEQIERSKEMNEEDLEYFGIAFFGKKEVLDELTKKFSLWI